MQAVYMSQGGRAAIERAYDAPTRRRLEGQLEFLDGVWDEAELDARQAQLQGVAYIFSTWGMMPLGKAQLETYFPQLRAVFYAAGSVQAFARPFLERGVRLFSAYGANAVPVAEYALAQIVLAGKGFYQAARRYQTEGYAGARAYAGSLPGNFGQRVGILGAGAIGRMVIERLRDYDLEVLTFDPFLSEQDARALGTRKASLPELFASCQVISNHLANNEQTRGMLNYPLFSLMGPTATFINTGRGAQVVEDGLVRALVEQPERTAVLDVTDPEPVPAGHPFYRLPNVVLTPHIAGSMGGEVARMGRYMLEEFERLAGRQPVRYEVKLSMLATMA